MQENFDFVDCKDKESKQRCQIYFRFASIYWGFRAIDYEW